MDSTACYPWVDLDSGNIHFHNLSAYLLRKTHILYDE